MGENWLLIIVIYGGSWVGGDRDQLLVLNSYFVQCGYNVVVMIYYLVLQYYYFELVRDVQCVIDFICNDKKFRVNMQFIVLLGCFVGGQIVF